MNRFRKYLVGACLALSASLLLGGECEFEADDDDGLDLRPITLNAAFENPVTQGAETSSRV